MQPPDSTTCSVFALIAFACAGVVQTVWFKSRLSKGFAIALDGGRTLLEQQAVASIVRFSK